jgi:hypothetical protein
MAHCVEEGILVIPKDVTDRPQWSRKHPILVLALFAFVSVAGTCPGLAQSVVTTTVPEAALAPPTTAASAAPTPFVDLGYTFQKDTRPGVFSRDNIWQATAGVEIPVTPSISLSTGLTYIILDRATRIPLGDYESEGITGFISSAFALSNTWSLQVGAGYGGAHIDQSRLSDNVLAFSRFDSISRFANVTLNGTYFFGDLLVRPYGQILYADTRYDAYVETDGAFNRGQLDTVGRASIGTDASYPFILSGVLLAPIIGAAFVYDVNRPSDYRDRTAFEFSAGFSILSGDLTAGVRYSTTVGRDDYLNHGARGYLTYRF